MDSIRHLSSGFDEINDDPGNVDMSSHSQNSIQTVDSTPLTETLSPAPIIIEASSPESTILTESSQSITGFSMRSNETYDGDGSGENSDESAVGAAILDLSDDSTASIEEFQNSPEVAEESENFAKMADELKSVTAGPSQEFQQGIAGPSQEIASPEYSGSLSETSQSTLDEFPEISQLSNLFELFETCPMTEKEMDKLYHNLVEGLKKNRRKLDEMQAIYERRQQLIKEFEAAREAFERTPERNEVIGCNPTPSMMPGTSCAVPDTSSPAPEKETLAGAEEAIPASGVANSPFEEAALANGDNLPVFENGDNQVSSSAASEGTSNTDETAVLANEEPVLVFENGEKEDERDSRLSSPISVMTSSSSDEISNIYENAGQINEYGPPRVETGENPFPYLYCADEENLNNDDDNDEFEPLDDEEPAPEPENGENEDERVSFPIQIAAINPTTTVVIPGPDNSNYDIEVTINTSARGIIRNEDGMIDNNNMPVLLHCVMPALHFLVETATQDPNNSDSGNESPVYSPRKYKK